MIEELINAKKELELIKNLKEQFGKSEKTQIRRSSSRICFGVEHGDYNGTNLFGASIGAQDEGFIWFMYARNTKGNINIKSLNYPNQIAKFKINEFISPKIVKEDKNFSWIKFPMGINYILKKCGFNLKFGLDGILIGKIPSGGLSRSASITLNIMLSLLEVNEIEIKNYHDIVDYSQAVENEYIGSPCGKLDQTMILFGKKDKAVFYSPKNRKVEWIDIPNSFKDIQIIILDTGTKRHGLQSTDYKIRQEECQKIVNEYGEKYNFTTLSEITPSVYKKIQIEEKNINLLKRLNYIFHANQRFEKMLNAFKKGDIYTFGNLINKDGISLRDDYDISGEHLEKMVDLAKKDKNVLGSRMAGGGRFGASFAIRKNVPLDNLKKIIDVEYKKCYPNLTYNVYSYDFSDGIVKLKY